MQASRDYVTKRCQRSTGTPRGAGETRWQAYVHTTVDRDSTAHLSSDFKHVPSTPHTYNARSLSHSHTPALTSFKGKQSWEETRC